MFNRLAVTDKYSLLTDDTVFNNNQVELRSILYEIETLRRQRVDEKEIEAETILIEIEDLKTNIPDLEVEKAISSNKRNAIY